MFRIPPADFFREYQIDKYTEMLEKATCKKRIFFYEDYITKLIQSK